MPYRRLPNTDTARLKALKAAFVKGKEIPPFKLAFSQSSFQKVSLFLPSFEQTILQHNIAYKTQTKKSKEYQVLHKKAKLYISHFIQVINMAIARGELKPEIRSYFGIPMEDKKVPPLVTEKDLIEWGKKIIDGESKRRTAGAPPITNPTAALVKVRYEAFFEAYNYQKTLQKNTQRTLNDLGEKRKQADSIILDVWNEVEKTFSDNPEDLKREYASEYGVIYVFRKNEINRLNLFSERKDAI